MPKANRVTTPVRGRGWPQAANRNPCASREAIQMNTTFDYHPDPCIALRLAKLRFSGGEGLPKVGLMRQSVECPYAVGNTGISTNVGCRNKVGKASARAIPCISCQMQGE